MPLLAVSGPGMQQSVNIEKEEILIGRVPPVDLVLPDEYVSRKHAKIYIDGSDYFLEDLNSYNGTTLNTKRVGRSPNRLQSGDVILVGKTTICFVKSKPSVKEVEDLSGQGEYVEITKTQDLAFKPSNQKVSTKKPTRVFLRVFISHSSTDDDFVTGLASDMLKKGALSPWVDHQEILPGGDWDKEIEKALEETPIMVVVLTPTAVNSMNVKAEWNYFLEKQKPVFPIVIKPCRVPVRLNVYQILNYEQSSEEQLNTLLGAIKGAANRNDE
jgi:pSer/pThr/pTyr-binding forkhead associated (FHA) protein